MQEDMKKQSIQLFQIFKHPPWARLIKQLQIGSQIILLFGHPVTDGIQYPSAARAVPIRMPDRDGWADAAAGRIRHPFAGG